MSKDPGTEIMRPVHEVFGSLVSDTPTAPQFNDHGKRLLMRYAGELANMAKLMKVEAAELRGCGLPELADWLIRVQLSVEETGEFAEALASGDLSKMAGELMDITWVTDGHHVALGTAAVKLEMYKELQRSNMSKLVDGKPLISEAGRWLKGPDFSPADMGPILEAAK